MRTCSTTSRDRVKPRIQECTAAFAPPANPVRASAPKLACITADPDQRTNISEDTDIKYQNITYFKCNHGIMRPKPKDHAQVDFIKATHELESLDWRSENFIGFNNNWRGEFVQLMRTGKNGWYADVPIDEDGYWTGYVWGAHPSTKEAVEMLRLFFEDVPWFASLEFRMLKHTSCPVDQPRIACRSGKACTCLSCKSQ